MEIQILGAHNSETKTTKCISMLIDDVLAIDAGGLTSSLTIDAQKKIKALLITHKHFDHIKDIPNLAINMFFQKAAATVYSTANTCDAIASYLLNDDVYPDFFNIPELNPALKCVDVEPGKAMQIEGYSVLPVRMNHKEITVGYQVTDRHGKSIFYSADTGKGLAECWRQITPGMLILEVTLPNSQADFAEKSNHLTPELLKRELQSFLQVRGYLPSVVTVHMMPDYEREIEAELAQVARELDASIKLAYEGMPIVL